MRHFAQYFVVPGLCHLNPNDLAFLSDEQFPFLAHFLQHAKRLESPNHTVDEVVCQQLNLETDIVPIAQHFNSRANVLIATPISLKADINSTWIQPAQQSNNITLIMHDLMQFFADDIELIEELEGHYIVRFKTAKVVTHLPFYLSVLGKKIDAYQDSIRENLAWFKLLNEMQMFIHGHHLNVSDAGHQLFNSCWFWGGDSTMALKHNKNIRCDDAVLQLALSHDNVQNHPRLIIKTDLLKYLKLNSSLQLDAFFYQFEQELKGCKASQVCIDTADGHCFIYDRLSRFKFWQNKPSLLNVLTLSA